MSRRRIVAAAILPVMLLAACDLALAYRRPVTTIPPAFKEAPGWQVASPAEMTARGPWWTLFNDPVLDALEAKVIVSNQTLAAAKAAYEQARALVAEQRAAWLPTVELSADANKVGSFEHTPNGGSSSSASTGSGSSGIGSGLSGRRNQYALTIGATWEPDLWGRIGNSVQQAGALAQASEADLANATLSAQGELALDYVQLRGLEARQAILVATSAAFKQALTIANNRYKVGVAVRSDVLQAETALRNARADAADLDRQRALLEHAVAVLAGENPSSFSLPKARWRKAVPAIPAILPATLLERRPDIAAAERSVAAANAAIGIERAAFFPAIDLSGDAGFSATSLGMVFNAASSVWSLGVSGALTLLDFGARSARVDQARAAYAQTVAEYRQTVLVAFQQTEDALVAARVLKTVAKERAAAAAAANQAEAIARNQYQAGQIGYADLIVTQTTALSARLADVQSTTDRQSAAVALIQAISGGWHDDRLTDSATNPALASQADQRLPPQRLG